MSVERYSLGGWAVVSSLRCVGLDVNLLSRRVAVAETRLRPLWPRKDCVLLQNAWTMEAWDVVGPLLSQYPRARRRRERLRRIVAWMNSSAARERIALTKYLAKISEERGVGPVVVLPVGTSLDLYEVGPRPPSVSIAEPFFLVPGSVQPYKDPLSALDYLAASHRNRACRSVVFAGPIADDDLAKDLTRRCAQIGVRPVFVNFSRPEMLWAYGQAEGVLLSSKLESLNFALGEAMLFANDVVASPLPVHREIVATLGGAYKSMDGRRTTFARPAIDQTSLISRWELLAEALKAASMGGSSTALHEREM